MSSKKLQCLFAIFQAVIAIFFFTFNSRWPERELGSESEMSDSWRNSDSGQESAESTHLLLSDVGPNYSTYTQEKVHFYGKSHRQDHAVRFAYRLIETNFSIHVLQIGDGSPEQITDIRGTVNITEKGACEV